MGSRRELNDERDLVDFKRSYETALEKRSKGALHCTVDVDYLAGSDVVGWYVGDRLVGGYVLNHAPPFRCLSAVPEDVAARWFEDRTPSQMCELTCIWRNDGIDAKAFATQVWPRIIYDCVTSHKRWILGIGFENRMNNVYRGGKPVTIYDGPSTDADFETVVHVYAYTKATMLATFGHNFVRKLILKPLGIASAYPGQRP